MKPRATSNSEHDKQTELEIPEEYYTSIKASMNTTQTIADRGSHRKVTSCWRQQSRRDFLKATAMLAGATRSRRFGSVQPPERLSQRTQDSMSLPSAWEGRALAFAKRQPPREMGPGVPRLRKGILWIRDGRSFD